MFLFLFQSDKNSGCYQNLYLPSTYNGKSGNGHLLLSHCRYFDKFYRNVPLAVLYFVEMFITLASTYIMICLLPLLMCFCRYGNL